LNKGNEVYPLDLIHNPPLRIQVLQNARYALIMLSPKSTSLNNQQQKLTTLLSPLKNLTKRESIQLKDNLITEMKVLPPHQLTTTKKHPRIPECASMAEIPQLLLKSIATLTAANIAPSSFVQNESIGCLHLNARGLNQRFKSEINSTAQAFKVVCLLIRFMFAGV
jgi:hypothetical protein